MDGQGLLERLIAAGTPAGLVAEVAMALGRAEAALSAAEERRARDRERKRKRPQTEAEAIEPRLPFSAEAAEAADVGGTDTAKEIPPHPHKKITPLKTPEGVHPPEPAETGSPRLGAKRLPDDFEVPEDWLAWAVERRGWQRSEAVEEAECFCRYWQSKGQGAAKRSWQKTWQNWVVNSRRRAASGGASSGDPPAGKWTPERMAAYRRSAASDEDAATRARRLRSIGSIARTWTLEAEE